ncbi:MAG: helix-hairpin-helix domain-containing protein [Chloroflexota bacterium]|nr:helix-hairpin-helix domain-containing protein [Chloroflexota bacterium]
MPNWRYLLLGVLFGLLATGAILLIAQPERGTPIVLQPAPTPTETTPPKSTATETPFQVQIYGEIAIPGVYTIEKSARLGELIDTAGGLTQQADVDRVNLAALLHDGDYFFIPAINEPIPETARNAPINSYRGDQGVFNYPLDLNKASQEALESLPGIGPVKAVVILEYREQVGTFSTIEELLNIEGIGEKTLESLKEYLIITP